MEGGSFADEFQTSTSFLVQLILALFIFYGAMSLAIALLKTGTLQQPKVQLLVFVSGIFLAHFVLGHAILVIEPALLRLFGAGGQGFLHLLSLRVTDPRDLSFLGVVSRVVAGVYTTILSSIFGVPLLLALLAYAINMYDALTPILPAEATEKAPKDANAAASSLPPLLSQVPARNMLQRQPSESYPEESNRFLLSEFDMDAFQVLCPLGTGITSSVVLCKVIKSGQPLSRVASQEQAGSLWAAHDLGGAGDRGDTHVPAMQTGSLWATDEDILDQVLDTVVLEPKPSYSSPPLPSAFAPGGPSLTLPPLDPVGWRRIEATPRRGSNHSFASSSQANLNKSPKIGGTKPPSLLSLESVPSLSMKKSRSVAALSEMAGDVASAEEKWWRPLQWLDDAQRTKSGMDEVFAVAPGLATGHEESLGRNLSELALARFDGSQISTPVEAHSPAGSRRSLSDASHPGGLVVSLGVTKKNSSGIKFSSGTDLSDDTLDDDQAARGRAGLEEMPELVAVKIMHKGEIEKMGMRRTVENERRLLVSCTSPFVCNVFGAFQDAHWAYILLEPVPAGDLAGLLEQRQVMFEDEARFYLGCLLLALEHLHDRRIACLDVKPENLLLDQWGYAKLCDLGIARQLPAGGDRGVWEFVGTPEYMSPEVIARQPVQPGLIGVAGPDLWAVGTLLFELLVGETPFADEDNHRTVALVNKFAADESHRRSARQRKYQRWASVARQVKRASTFDSTQSATANDDQDDEEDDDEGSSEIFRPMKRLSSPAHDLAVKLLRPNPVRRLGCKGAGARTVMDHRWFDSLDWQGLRARQLRSPFVPNPVTLAPPFRGEEVEVDITRAKPLTLTELQRAQSHIRGLKEHSVVDAKRNLWKGFSPALVSPIKLDKSSKEFASTLQHVRELLKGDD